MGTYHTAESTQFRIQARMSLDCFPSQLGTNGVLVTIIINQANLKTFPYSIKPARSDLGQELASVLPRLSGAQAAEGQVETKAAVTFYLMPNPWGGKQGCWTVRQISARWRWKERQTNRGPGTASHRLAKDTKRHAILWGCRQRKMKQKERSNLFFFLFMNSEAID